MISEFKGEYRFLSNFWPAPITMQGLVYPSVEHAYQAAKTTDPGERISFQRCRADEAKRLGRLVSMRCDWDEMKLDVMRRMVRMKFAAGSPLAAKLLATGDQELREGNYWNDTYWGYSIQKGVGENWLGRLLMERRDELRRAPLPRPPVPASTPARLAPWEG